MTAGRSKYERILSLSWMLANVHGSDGDCLGKAARELIELTENMVSEEDRESLAKEFDC